MSFCSNVKLAENPQAEGCKLQKDQLAEISARKNAAYEAGVKARWLARQDAAQLKRVRADEIKKRKAEAKAAREQKAQAIRKRKRGEALGVREQIKRLRLDLEIAEDGNAETEGDLDT